MSKKERESEEFAQEAEEDFGDDVDLQEIPEGTAAAGEADQADEGAVDYRDSLMRLQAEFENYKKRLAREREVQRRSSKEHVLKEFLPVLDNLERAVAHGGANEEVGKVIEGVELVLKQFREVFEHFGIESIDAGGKVFDPHVHEAMSRVETEGDPPDGTIVEVYQKGYLLDGRILRPAMVCVAKLVDENGGE